MIKTTNDAKTRKQYQKWLKEHQHEISNTLKVMTNVEQSAQYLIQGYEKADASSNDL